ncbi:MAG: hypothetical protein HOP29_03365 [Phycisphaerales bacterium]|nr:hypothetical protein [Phycisphaerales bacterium]
MGRRDRHVLIASAIVPVVSFYTAVQADPLLYVPIAAIEAASLDAAIRATAAAAELEWRMSEAAWGLRLDDVGLASLFPGKSDDAPFPWMRDLDDTGAAMVREAGGSRRPDRDMNVLPSDLFNPPGDSIRSADGMVTIDVYFLNKSIDDGERLKRDVPTGDDAALASVLQRRSGQWELGGGDSDSLGGLLAMRGAPSDARVRAYRPLENTYYLDWPWVQREGRNVFFLLFGPPSFVLGIVMTIYIITRATRRVR